MSEYGQFVHVDPASFAANIHSSVYVNAPAGLFFPGDPQYTAGNGLSSTRWLKFDPRAGLVWDQRGIKHTTSECTLRGFTCSGANVDPKTATPAEISKIRKIQIGYQVDGITGGLAVKDQDKSQK